MKSLIYFFFKKNGRTNNGKITVRHKGGGHKKLYRVINFSYNRLGDSKRVIALNYNPNCYSSIMLIKNSLGAFEYLTSFDKANVGSHLEVGPNYKNLVGFSKPLWNIPLGLELYNVELTPKKGAQIARASGSYCSLIATHSAFAVIKLPSKELRLVRNTCFATIGRVLNNFNYLKNCKKAGRKRWRGIRPTVRGVAMNPIDHPHGGGEGRCPVGHKSPLSPWGKPTQGLKTRRCPNKFILSKKKH